MVSTAPYTLSFNGTLYGSLRRAFTLLCTMSNSATANYVLLPVCKDGRIREYEAWSCDDVDSVHNDYQRHLPYLWMFPQFERQKVKAWGSWAMRKDGSVNECLAGFGHGPMDLPTGEGKRIIMRMVWYRSALVWQKCKVLLFIVCVG